MKTRAFIHEVAPRDGLQSRPEVLATAVKLEAIERLAAARPDSLEIGSFVRPDRLPQLADAEAVAAALAGRPWRPGVALFALVVNWRGYERFRASGLDGITVVVSATEGHSQANAGMSMARALAEAEALTRAATADGRAVRAAIAMAFGCPYDGAPAPARVAELGAALLAAGAGVLLLADTLGQAHPAQIEEVGARVLALAAGERLGLHAHDTAGRGAANARAAWQLGFRHFDAAAGGLGGCPYAPGAAGNLATDRLLEALEAAGASHGLDRAALAAASRYLEESLAAARHAAGGPSGSR